MKPISFDDFKSSYNNFRFDNTLLSIHFDRVELELGSQKTRRVEFPSSGREEMKHFFGWLYVDKGVRTIVKVTVEDREQRVHSDQVIEDALKNPAIEVLDWRKYDICPWTIREACRNSPLREIHLWWNGNNAVLRSWSEPEGLVKLQHLQHIYLHRSQV